MTDQTRVNLWREAWAACKENLRAFLPSVFGLGILLIICNFYYIPDQIHQVMERLESIDNPSAAVIPHVTPPVTNIAHACGMLINLIGFYYFTVLYFRRAPLATKPELGTDSFFNWLGQIALSVLGIFGLALGILAIIALIGTGMVMFFHADEKAMAAFASLAIMCAVIYGGVRFCLAGPLALLPVATAWKASWKLTKGNWWRLVWHYCMMISVVWLWLILVLLVPAIVILFMVPTTPDSPLLVGVLSTVIGLSASFNLAGSSIFCCVAARVLEQEQALQNVRESV